MIGPDSEGLQAEATNRQFCAGGESDSCLMSFVGEFDGTAASLPDGWVILHEPDANDEPPAPLCPECDAWWKAEEAKRSTASSPVVPSVAAVPVEVPEEAAIVDAMVDAIYAAYADPESYGHTRPLYQRDMGIGLRAAYPLIAARVRAEERQRIAPMLLVLHRIMEDAIVRGGYREGEAEHVERLMDSLAAGSAVPVATPTEPTVTERAGCYVVTFPTGDTSTWDMRHSYLFNPGTVWQHRHNADALEAIINYRGRTAPAEQDGQR